MRKAGPSSRRLAACRTTDASWAPARTTAKNTATCSCRWHADTDTRAIVDVRGTGETQEKKRPEGRFRALGDVRSGRRRDVALPEHLVQDRGQQQEQHARADAQDREEQVGRDARAVHQVLEGAREVV